MSERIVRRFRVTRRFVEAEPMGEDFARAVPVWAHNIAFLGYREKGWSACQQPSGKTVAAGKWGDELWLLSDGNFGCTEYPEGFRIGVAHD